MPRTVRAFTLSIDFQQRLEAFFVRLLTDENLKRKLLLPPRTAPVPSAAPVVDSLNLTEENYRVLRTKAGIKGSSVTGLELLNLLINRPDLRRFVEAYTAEEIRKNRLAVKAALRPAKLPLVISRSRVIEALLTVALETLKQDAPVKTGGRTRRNAKKAA